MAISKKWCNHTYMFEVIVILGCFSLGALTGIRI